ncbi:MAG: hypothetical protein EOO10_15440 [Chitinophagaceae bacterium]|nr:MAG: hypothetical protein EOO10_15440 [Chitinophagaceae bacterium]
MADFTQKLDTTEGSAFFTFTRIYTVRGVIYFTAVTGRGFRHFFHMEERGGMWRIVESPKPPEWIYQYEEELARTILQNRS